MNIANGIPSLEQEKEFIPSGEKLKITRYFRDQVDIEQIYLRPKATRQTLKEKVCSKVNCTGSSVLGYFLSLFPLFEVIRNYKIKSYILGDVVGGISSACLHFPQGLAFGILASLSPAQGLYTSFFPVICYVIFGTSQHISFGTNAVIALFTAEIVEMQVEKADFNMSGSVSGNDSISVEETILQFKTATASGASFFVGIILLAMGFLRLGFITSFMSSSFVSAFTTASAVHIMSSQLTKALGLKLPGPLITGPGKLVLLYIEICKNIVSCNVAAVVTSIICIIVLIIVKDCINERCKDKMKMPVPIDLILIIVATIISHFGRLSDKFDLAVVNDIPSGIPAPTVPRLSVDYLGNSFVVAIIVFVLTISMARVCEIKHDYQVDDNQELVAYGISNFVSSFFGCFPSCTAPPRTMILSALGAKTTLNGVFTVIFMLLVLLLIGPLFTSLPQSVLAIMVIMAVKDLLIQIKQLSTFWRVNKFDFIIWLGTFLSGVLIDFPYALYIGVLLCFFTVVLQSQLSKNYILMKSETEDLFFESSRYKNIADVQGIKIFRMESSLYFATSDIFRKRLYSATTDPRKFHKPIEKLYKVIGAEEPINNSDDENVIPNVNSDVMNHSETSDHINFIVLDCSAMNYIDSNGIIILSRIAAEYKRINIQVLLANPSICLLEIIEHAELPEVISKERIFPTILDAIRYALNVSASN